VKLAFKKLDVNSNGTLDVNEVKDKFDPTRHPEVKNGFKSADEVKSEFYDLFSTNHTVS
jgi:hypothetical protein